MYISHLASDTENQESFALGASSVRRRRRTLTSRLAARQKHILSGNRPFAKRFTAHVTLQCGPYGVRVRQLAMQQ